MNTVFPVVKKIRFFLWFIVFTCSIALIPSPACIAATGIGGRDSLKVGEDAPPFVMRDLIGDTAIFLRDYTGKTLRENWRNNERFVVVLSFWATWCQPCKVEIPKLTLLANKFKGQAVKFFLINTMEQADQTEDSVRAQYRTRAYHLPCLIDPAIRVAGLYTVRGLPMLVVIDKFGVVRQVNRGYHENFDIELENTIHQLLAEQQKNTEK